MASNLSVGDMKMYSKEFDNRSWTSKIEDRRSHILKYPTQQIPIRPIPLPLLHDVLKTIYGNRNQQIKNNMVEKAKSVEKVSREIQYQFEHFEIKFELHEDRKDNNLENEQQPDQILPRTNRYIHDFDTNSEEEIITAPPARAMTEIPKRNPYYVAVVNQIENHEQPESKKLTEIFNKDRLQKIPENDETDSHDPQPHHDGQYDVVGPSEEDEEIFLDAINLLPDESKTSGPSDHSQRRHPNRDDDEDGDMNGVPSGRGFPPDDGSPDGGGDNPSQPPFLSNKKMKCETCEIYLLQCCKYECTVDNLFTYSSALENRCDDFEKILKMYCTRLTASRIIIKHLQEKNNQLLQKWETIQGDEGDF